MSIVGRIFGCLWLLLVAGCVTPVASQTKQPLSPDAARFQTIVERLAAPQMEGRGPGTDGIDLARDWIVERFRDTGLQPAFGDSYTQHFTVALTVREVKVRLFADGRPIRGEVHVLGCSAAAPGRFSGPAVFAGYGVGDVPDGALRGKVCVIYRFEPMVEQRTTLASDLVRKIDWAAERGAAAVVIVNPPSRPAAALPSAYGSTYGVMARIPAVVADYAAFKGILHNVGDGGVQPLSITLAGEVQIDVQRVPVSNIAGILPGAGASAEQCIIIGAHYDHLGYGSFGSRTRQHAIHPGADDNASGVAMLLMLAQRLSQQELPADHPTILFVAFSAEERGRVGSHHFVGHLEEAGLSPERIAAMINLDMVGRLRNDTLLVSGSFDHWPGQLDRAADGAGLTLRRTHEGAGPSDHAPFIEIGIPGVHFFTGVHDDYHTPRDTADRINATGATQVLDMIERLVVDLAQP